MCFIKSSTPEIVTTVEQKEPVKRQEANAQATKNSNKEKNAFLENLKTSPIGLEDTANIQRKTLLGE